MQDFNFKITWSDPKYRFLLEQTVIGYDAKPSRLYVSLDPTLSHDKPLTATEALNLWLSIYSVESISHMTAPVTYVLDTYFYEVQRFPISAIHTVDSGGGNFIDLVYLQSGKVLSITDECALLHASERDFFEGFNALAYMNFPWAEDYHQEEAHQMYSLGQPAWIKSIGYYHGLVELNMYFKQSIILNQDKFTITMTEVL